jgi:glycine betaine/proline transport system ATP-binding protein
MIEVTDLWKLFGSGRTDEAIELARQGADRTTISARTGHTVGVQDVSFTVDSGESFVVMGLSGSGKSTLIRCLAGLHPMTLGDVRIDDTSLANIDEDTLRSLRRSKMAMVFQHFGLLPHRTVIDNVAYGLEVQGVDKTTRRSRAAEAVGVVGLAGWESRFPDQLSGGMQQRVGLARALVLDPDVLFFDEPFSALDPLIRHDMQNELLRLQQLRRRTIVFITHDFDEAVMLGDRIAVMKDGRFEQVGTAEEVVSHPATDYVRAFTQRVAVDKVVKIRTIMTPVGADHAALKTSERTAVAETPVSHIIPAFLADRSPVAVLDEAGRIIGCVTVDAVAALLERQASVA